jgi:hypothetical protein
LLEVGLGGEEEEEEEEEEDFLCGMKVVQCISCSH